MLTLLIAVIFVVGILIGSLVTSVIYEDKISELVRKYNSKATKLYYSKIRSIFNDYNKKELHGKGTRNKK
jgi:uncharacterized membrane protein YciS (DUF1049 family)